MKQNKRLNGFTLIELLVSMLLVSILGGAVFVSFAQGVRVWQASVREGSRGEEEFFLERLRSELRNAFLYGKMALNGQPDVLEFHTWMRPEFKKNAPPPRSVPAMVRYRFVPSQKQVQKEVVFYEKMLHGQGGANSAQVVLDRVEQMTFEYDSRVSTGGGSVWKSRWKDACFPGAVKLTMNSRSGYSGKETHVIALPSQGECSEIEDDRA